jgi:hypothetical protein
MGSRHYEAAPALAAGEHQFRIATVNWTPEFSGPDRGTVPALTALADLQQALGGSQPRPRAVDSRALTPNALNVSRRVRRRHCARLRFHQAETR